MEVVCGCCRWCREPVRRAEGRYAAVDGAVALLGIGFVGLLYTFRLTQRRLKAERQDAARREKRRNRRTKR